MRSSKSKRGAGSQSPGTERKPSKPDEKKPEQKASPKEPVQQNQQTPQNEREWSIEKVQKKLQDTKREVSRLETILKAKVLQEERKFQRLKQTLGIPETQ